MSACDRPYKGLTPAEAFAAVADFEARTGRAAQRPTAFIRATPWMVARPEWGPPWAVWRGDRASRLGGQPVTKAQRMKAAVRRLRDGVRPSNRCRATVSAGFVRLGNHVSAMYPHEGPPACAKIAVRDDPEQPRAAPLARELAVREQVAALVRVPAVLDADLTGPYPYLVDVLTDGTHPVSEADRRHAAAVVLEALLALWRETGVSGESVADYLSGVTAEAVAEGLDRAGVEAGAWRSAFDRLAGDGRAVPCSMGHGDLNRGNVILDAEGAVTVLDWEAGGVMPLAHDLHALATLAPQGRDALAARVDGALGGSTFLPVQDQVQLLLLRRVGRWPEALARMQRRGYADAEERAARLVAQSASALRSWLRS